MTRMYFFIIIALIISPIAGTDSLDSYVTGAKPNGKYWNILDNKSKGAFITGMREGFAVTSEVELEYIKAGIDCKERSNVIQFIADSMPEGLSLEEIITYIDKFYLAKTKLNIPVSTVYLQFVTEKRLAKNITK